MIFADRIGLVPPPSGGAYYLPHCRDPAPASGWKNDFSLRNLRVLCASAVDCPLKTQVTAKTPRGAEVFFPNLLFAGQTKFLID